MLQNDKIKKLQSEKETILYENLKKISEEVEFIEVSI